MIQLKNIHKKFGDLEVLKGIDLEITEGEVLTIIGPSGSGKSTLLRCINYLETPDKGDVYISGKKFSKNKHNVNKLRREVGMVFQHFNLFPHMTVLENVMEGPLHVLKRPKKETKKKAMEILGKVGLDDKAPVYPDTLSGGQKQRVAIARALAMEPKAILFDEPTSALDPELVGEVITVMKDLAKEGMTMAVVTHEMWFAEEAADEVIMMDEGKIVEQGKPSVMFNNPEDPRTRQFLQNILR